ncbi:MAG TPA: hypothetical protein VGH75_01950, partial [Steroidobacteraceae bacterium]
AARDAATFDIAPFNPPRHSIAVLPFVNMSGDPSQEYFSDGLTEELLNSLSRINELQVAARISSFSFQGAHLDILTVARKLNVASVLEGSVRRSGHTVRITAQLDNALTGFHIWSQTFDRNLGDVLQLQTEIATAVVESLKITLLGDVAERIELGGTRSPAAFDAYLRGSKAFSSSHDLSSLQSAITEYTEAIRLDPSYALAFAGRSRARSAYATEAATGPALREFLDKAQADAREALKLAPELAEGHLALAFYFTRGSLDFTHADEAYESAMVLAPGNAEVLADSGRFAVIVGRFDAGPAAARSRSTRSVCEAATCSGRRCILRAGIRRRLPLSEKSSVSSPITRRPTVFAGSPITGSVTSRVRALRAKPSRTPGRVSGASQ